MWIIIVFSSFAILNGYWFFNHGRNWLNMFACGFCSGIVIACL
jgi:hypothetical protein